MEELESQIAKIQLGNFKHTSSYVFALAEKAPGSDAELYVIAELPMLNPAAEDSCEKICLAVAAAIKRVYKKPLSGVSFETAIAQINDELGKLATLGQTHWINKLNGVVAVKSGSDFSIATCGKVAAYLFRGQEFTDISCSPGASHPLKTFENYSTGKIRLGDLLILSTTQLFNYIALDRLKTILVGAEFLRASQTVVELLKQNAGPETAFATILNLQIPPGQTSEQLDLENYVVETKAPVLGFLKPALDFVKSIIPTSGGKRVPQTNLPGMATSNSRFSDLKNNARSFLAKGKNALSSLGRGVTAGREQLRAQNFKAYSPEKKFFLISLGVLILACVFSLGVALRFRGQKQNDGKITEQLKQVQTLLDNAQTSYLYNDQQKAQDYLAQAVNKMPGQSPKASSNKTLYQTVQNQLTDLESKIQKQTTAQVENLGSLASGSMLIKLPNILAVQSQGGIVSYSLTTGRTEDGLLKADDNIVNSVYIGGNNAVIYNGSSLRLWDFTTGKLNDGTISNIPGKENFGGLAWYGTNSKVYIIDKKLSEVVNFVVFGGAIVKPGVSLTDDSLKNAGSLTIDSAIYITSGGIIKKFQSGRPAEFNMPTLSKQLSETAKIYTEKDFKNLYVLDPGSNRLIILNKTGQLQTILTSDKFTKLVDFSVDEKNKTIYILNDSSLLKVTIP